MRLNGIIINMILGPARRRLRVSDHEPGDLRRMSNRDQTIVALDESDNALFHTRNEYRDYAQYNFGVRQAQTVNTERVGSG